VPYRILPAPDAAGVIGDLKSGAADIGFLAYDETRAREVEFGPPFAVMYNSYVVRADSALQKSADVDRAGLTVAAVRGQTQELFVSSHLKNARVRVAQRAAAVVEVPDRRRGGCVRGEPTAALDAASETRRTAHCRIALEMQRSLVVNAANAKLDAHRNYVDEMRARAHQACIIRRRWRAWMSRQRAQ
jgi:hypothetical protein